MQPLIMTQELIDDFIEELHRQNLSEWEVREYRRKEDDRAY